jgi:replication factor C subunit 3/5
MNETNQKTNNIPWIEKYRPQTLDDIVSHKHIISILRKYIRQQTFPNLIIFGAPGTGKTSIINVCAKELFGKFSNVMTLEINASEERGIDIIRNRIIPFANSSQTFTWGEISHTIKLVILDEADSMTMDAQLALKNVIDTYSKLTRFCLICNCIKKIHYSIVSRCVKFRVHPLPSSLMYEKVKTICGNENVNISDNAINKIISHSHGDMRRVINILQSISSAYDKVTKKCVIKFLNEITDDIMNEILETLILDNIKTSTNKLLNIIQYHGFSFGELISHINDNVIENLLTGKVLCKKCVITNKQLYNIISGLGKLEYLLYSNVNINILVSNLASVFYNVVH